VHAFAYLILVVPSDPPGAMAARVGAALVGWIMNEVVAAPA